MIENSRALFENDYSSIEVGEIRKFQVDKTKHPYCTLTTNQENPNVVEFNIEKQRNIPGEGETMRRLIAKIDIDKTKSYGKSDYAPGYIQRIEVEPRAGGCGLGTILTRLTMNEDKIHKIAYRKNVALDSLDEPNFQEIKTWAKSSCSKLILAEVSLKGCAVKRAGMYFKGAKAAGFTLMFIKRETDDENPSLYPSTGACSVETLQARYDGTGCMIDDGGNRLRVTGDDMEWFWCFPKDETEKCTKCQCSIS